MSYADNPYSAWGTVAAQADVNERAGFIRKTYLHLLGAILAFIGLEAVLLNLPGIDGLVRTMMESRFGWLMVLGGFMAVSWIADNWARSATSLTKQYMGLGLYVVAEAVIFVPLLYIAIANGQSQLIGEAALLTAIIFGGLTAIVVFSGADFSFLRNTLFVLGLGAMAIIVISAVFGFNLGVLFISCMICLASGYILYHTSQVMQHYQIGQHVAAALSLFAAVALLFWYILQLLMSLNRR